jgi:aminoglycoside phosphotransferase (APT) family kinase protein
MELQLAPSAGDEFRRPLTTEQLLDICSRPLGSTRDITAIREITGGTINSTYRITRAGHPDVILRVAPPETHPHLFRHEQRLLRREYYIQPFLAPIGYLLPALVAADFTHQLIDRDYLFQAAIAGDLWRDVRRSLTSTEEGALWHQLGSIACQIHSVKQHAFGPPDPIPIFPNWGDALLSDFHNILHDMAASHLPMEHMQRVTDYVAFHRDLFDRLETSSLLHGDLWLNNILIQRSTAGLQIVGVLDAGFAHWGDPAADWTMMRMLMDPPEGGDSFWTAYGLPTQHRDSAVRSAVYQARSVGWSLLELQRRHHPDTARMWRKLEDIIADLQTSA